MVESSNEPKLEAPGALDRLFSLADAGWSQRRIAKELGCSHVSVGAHLRRRAQQAATAQALAASVAPAPAPAQPTAAEPGPDSLLERLTDFATSLSAIGMKEQADLTWEAIMRLRAIDAALEAPPEAASPIVEVPADLSTLGALDLVRTLVREYRVDHANWSAIGHATAATRSARTIAMLLPILARLERQARDESGVVSVPKGDVEQTKALHRQKAAHLLTLGIRCGKCYSELQQAFGEGEPWDDGPPGPAKCCKCGGPVGSELGVVLLHSKLAYEERAK